MEPFIFCLALALASVHSQDIVSDGYCSRDLKPEAPGAGLAFSKELNARDFAKQFTYKGLRCCARHYDTIEWYKDGVPLLMKGSQNVSTFLYGLERNQSLTSPSVLAIDNGNYTCIARSGQQHITNTIAFRVWVKDKYEGEPLVSIIPEDQWALPGEAARFCCEAYVGFGDMTQFSEVYWMAADTDFKFVNSVVGNANETRYKNVSGELLGAFLTFNTVNEEDYRTYACHITNSGKKNIVLKAVLHKGVDPHTKIQPTYKITIVILIVIAMICALLVAIYTKWQLEIHLFQKDRFGKLEENDDKMYDVFVSYDPEDSEFVLGLLVPVLERRFKYSTYAWERDCLAGDFIPETYTEKVRQSRRFLLVLSPALANNTWCTYAMYIALENMMSRHSRIICIMLQNVKWEELTLVDGDPKNPTLRKVLRVVKSIRWQPTEPPEGSDKFWKSLRLYLPPRRDVQYHYHTDADGISSSEDSTFNLM